MLSAEKFLTSVMNRQLKQADRLRNATHKTIEPHAAEDLQAEEAIPQGSHRNPTKTGRCDRLGNVATWCL